MQVLRTVIAVCATSLFLNTVAAAPVGIEQAAPGEIDLVIDVDTGEALLIGNDATPALLSSYQIDSPNLQLSSDGFISLASQFSGWVDVSNPPGRIAEIDAGSLGSTDPDDLISIDGVPISLGIIFTGTTVAEAETLTFLYGDLGEDGIIGNVVALSTPIPEPLAALGIGSGLALIALRRTR